MLPTSNPKLGKSSRFFQASVRTVGLRITPEPMAPSDAGIKFDELSHHRRRRAFPGLGIRLRSSEEYVGPVREPGRAQHREAAGAACRTRYARHLLRARLGRGTVSTTRPRHRP